MKMHDKGQLLIELAEMYLENKWLKGEVDYYRTHFLNVCKEVDELKQKKAEALLDTETSTK